MFHQMNMNNEQKNTYVKKQITAALLALLKEKNSRISLSANLQIRPKSDEFPSIEITRAKRIS